MPHTNILKEFLESPSCSLSSTHPRIALCSDRTLDLLGVKQSTNSRRDFLDLLRLNVCFRPSWMIVIFPTFHCSSCVSRFLFADEITFRQSFHVSLSSTATHSSASSSFKLNHCSLRWDFDSQDVAKEKTFFIVRDMSSSE